MFSSNAVKIFFAAVLFACQSCSFWRGQTNADTVPPTPFVAAELKSDVPFSTKEPAVYQTEIVTTGADGSEEKIFAAKNGASRLLILNFQAKTELALLHAGENQTFVFARQRKICAENKSGTAVAGSEPLNDFLTNELINRKSGAKYETLGAENNLAKYRVIPEDAPNSETLIYVDAEIGLPVRQEFYSVAGGRKILTLTTELRSFKGQTETGVFELPKDCRRVSPKEFYELNGRAKQTNE